MKHIVVIGGGAAGMMAAIAAAKQGARVTLFEKNEKTGKKIFITHGHLYNVKYTLNNLYYAAREKNADIVCFGHTHNPMSEYVDGLYVLNPGSCHGYGASYAYIDVTPQGIMTNILKA